MSTAINFDQIGVSADFATRTIEHVVSCSSTGEYEVLRTFQQPEWQALTRRQWDQMLAEHTEAFEAACATRH